VIRKSRVWISVSKLVITARFLGTLIHPDKRLVLGSKTFTVPVQNKNYKCTTIRCYIIDAIQLIKSAVLMTSYLAKTVHRIQSLNLKNSCIKLNVNLPF
jgi:hypothetical protein